MHNAHKSKLFSLNIIHIIWMLEHKKGTPLMLWDPVKAFKCGVGEQKKNENEFALKCRSSEYKFIWRRFIFHDKFVSVLSLRSAPHSSIYWFYMDAMDALLWPVHPDDWNAHISLMIIFSWIMGSLQEKPYTDSLDCTRLKLIVTFVASYDN